MQDSYFETNLLKIGESIVEAIIRMPLGAAAVLKWLFSFLGALKHVLGRYFNWTVLLSNFSRWSLLG